MSLNEFNTQTESFQRILLQFNIPKLMTLALNLISDDLVKIIILSSLKRLRQCGPMVYQKKLTMNTILKYFVSMNCNPKHSQIILFIVRQCKNDFAVRIQQR